MRDLDFWNKQDFEKHRTSSSAPRWRVALEEPRVVNSAAPVGLWRNCYDPGWLKKLDAPRRRLLKIINEDFDFTMPDYKDSIIKGEDGGGGEEGGEEGET
ncbi:hypothetical protein GSI_08507 [Ganoderma sinense ZZ0214-1]|uniref:Uncharacterized protein n=1 Tax=Ganoderma sinense ZZ0214-1 TaxID=1077348 RepID=A0A2G8S3W8_9APHY|nr:hypothetical protein GSI_08507 [Ganoderma sinense ZZ0214-1]